MTPYVKRETQHRVGRPRSETVQERKDALIAAATRVFLRDGYGLASIDKVASEAGVSTRTIYQRFKNKADLMVAVVTRLVDRDIASMLSLVEFEQLDVKDALVAIGRTLTERTCNPDAASLFRILATEAYRFPGLAAQMRAGTQERIVNVIQCYLQKQIARGSLRLADPARAASLFLQMIVADMHEHFLFGSPGEFADIDFAAHVAYAVEIFLCGTLPRVDAPGHDAD